MVKTAGISSGGDHVVSMQQSGEVEHTNADDDICVGLPWKAHIHDVHAHDTEKAGVRTGTALTYEVCGILCLLRVPQGLASTCSWRENLRRSMSQTGGM